MGMLLRDAMLDYIRGTYLKQGYRFYAHTSFVGMWDEEVKCIYSETKRQHEDLRRNLVYVNGGAMLREDIKDTMKQQHDSNKISRVT